MFAPFVCYFLSRRHARRHAHLAHGANSQVPIIGDLEAMEGPGVAISGIAMLAQCAPAIDTAPAVE